jgi:hypothetical protein
MISQNRYKGQPLASALGTVDPRAVRTSTTVIARKSLLILKVSFESYVSLAVLYGRDVAASRCLDHHAPNQKSTPREAI